MPTMKEQIATAKAAGYSDEDIAKHLSARADLAPKIKQATAAGYKPAQIIAHLAGSETAQSQTAPDEPPEGSVAEYMKYGRDAVARKRAQGDLHAIKMAVPNLVAGGVRGAGSIGATIVYPYDKYQDIDKGDRGQTVESLISGKAPLSRNEERRKAMDTGLEYMGAEPRSLMYGTGKLGAELAGTWGVGGVVGNTLGRGASAVGASDAVANALATSARTGGFSTGMPAASTFGGSVANMGTRMAGGAATGGATAGMINPADAGTGAIIGGALPLALTGVAKAGATTGRMLYSLAQPFTTAGQERLAGGIMNRFSKDGRTALDNAEHVIGSRPTLAEATGNAGLASLQRNVGDTVPGATNRFLDRQVENAAARTSAFDEVAGDTGKLDFFRNERSAAGGSLYEQALTADTSANLTPYIKGQISQLLKRPSITEARKTAQRWAKERGERPSFDGNMRGLHDMKTAIDDQISEAVRAGKGGEAKALAATQDKLLDVMEKLSPAYKEARVTYAEMSKPINQMEVLQGLRLTDAKGNMTLSKVQNAIDGLERKMTGPGTDAAKSLTDAQVGTLRAIRDDLLRKTNLDAGKAAGSNTLQNIATDNIVSSALPEKAAEIVGGKVGGVAGQLGRLMYSGPNDAVRNRLADMMLDPEMAKRAMDAAGRPILDGRRAMALRDLANRSAPTVYRSAPVLSSDR